MKYKINMQLKVKGLYIFNLYQMFKNKTVKSLFIRFWFVMVQDDSAATNE